MVLTYQHYGEPSMGSYSAGTLPCFITFFDKFFLASTKNEEI